MSNLLLVLLFAIAVILGLIVLKSLRRSIVMTSVRLSSALELLSNQIHETHRLLEESNRELLKLRYDFLESGHAVPLDTSQLGMAKQPLCTHIAIPGSTPVLLNIGCGSTYDKRWINLDLNPVSSDVYRVDISKPLPLDDDSVDFAYASHVLEHLAPHVAPRFMQEVRRVLKPEGTFRVVVPDLEQITTEYLRSLQVARSGDLTAALRHEWMLIELIDQVTRQTNDGGEMFRFMLRHGDLGLEIATQRLGTEIVGTMLPWDATKTKAEWIREISQDEVFSDSAIFERRANMSLLDSLLFRRSGEPHLWMYDDRSLFVLFESTGFVNVKRMTASTSRIADFASYRLDSGDDGSPRKPDSLYVEAVKPSSTIL